MYACDGTRELGYSHIASIRAGRPHVRFQTLADIPVRPPKARFRSADTNRLRRTSATDFLLGRVDEMTRRFRCTSKCQLKGSLGRFLALKKYQLALEYLAFPIAFQADDEGSIPFTRSNVFNGLGRGNPAFCVTPGCCFAPSSNPKH